MITERAPAKINLALHVRRRREDGYHDLETLFAFAADGDTVTLEQAERWSFHITGPFAADLTPSSRSPAQAEAPSPREAPIGTAASFVVEGRTPAFAGEANLVQRAANRFVEAFPATPPQAITLDKHLPVASGIGGGSADAAATLRTLARLAGVASDHPSVAAIARGLGADVPACLLGQTSFGTGAGEQLVPIEGRAGTPLLLVNPGVAVSTAAVFRGWDGIDRGPIPPGQLLDRARGARNDLAPAARLVAPVIAEVEALLAAQPGVLLSRMSGSGATCFALFETEQGRDAAARQASDRGWWVLASHMAG